MKALAASLREAFGADRVKESLELAPMTTFRVGGPADLFIETRASEEIVTALRLAESHHIDVTILGGGSNVLVSDAGTRGLVVRPRGGEARCVSSGSATLVRADAALTINGLVRWTINHGLASLEAWAYWPGLPAALATPPPACPPGCRNTSSRHPTRMFLPPERCIPTASCRVS